MRSPTGLCRCEHHGQAEEEDHAKKEVAGVIILVSSENDTHETEDGCERNEIGQKSLAYELSDRFITPVLGTVRDHEGNDEDRRRDEEK